MATILKSVDKTIVNFEDTFTYTIDISFSGIEGDINDAYVIDFIPTYIHYNLPPVSSTIRSIIQTKVDGGTLITFNFGEITNIGISIAIDVICKFKLGTENKTSFENSCVLYINNMVGTSIKAKIVTLSVDEDFIISKNIVIPKNKQSTPGGRAIYTIILSNHLKSQGGNGDLGAKIKNVVISDLLPDSLTIDSSFPIIGNDISGNAYTDNSSNNKIGSVDGNQITFTLDSYYGSKYRIIFVCNVNEDVDIGSSITNTVYLGIDSIDRGSSSDTLLVTNSNYKGSISEYAPNYSNIGNYISFELSALNSGNQDLLNFTIEDIIPDEVSIYRINTGSFMVDVINIAVPEIYTIEYEVNNSGNYSLLGSYNTQLASYVNLPNLNKNEKVTKLRWNIPNFPVGIIPRQNIILDGIFIFNNSNNLISNIGIIEWEVNNVKYSYKVTKIVESTNISELNISKSIVNNTTSVIPGQTIRYSITFNGYYSQINNPIVCDLLSDKLEYIGNELYTFYDYFSNVSINSTNINFTNLVPIQKEVINNFNNTGKVLIRYNMNGFSLKQKGKFTVQFDVKVNVGKVGSISNNATLGIIGSNSVIADGQLKYLDVDDRDSDNITNEYLALSQNVNITILYYAGLTSHKMIKGDLDKTFIEIPYIGLTYEGGKINYKLIVTNSGNLVFNYIEILDILPHINDTGVILTNIKRNSQYNVYNITQIRANIMENNVVIDDASLIVEYSESYNPLRFSLSNLGNDTIGVDDDWSTTLPNPITSTCAVKIILSNKVLLPNQSLVVNIACLAPVGVSPNLIAYNSVAMKASYINENNIIKSLIPVEPQKVGMKILRVEKGSIEGKTWLDKNKNGIIDDDEFGINGIIVRLLSKYDTLVAQTITSNNVDNIPGYYLFNNLDEGKYYIQFIRPENLYFTKYDESTENNADTNTGLTQLIDINTQNKDIFNKDAGFINNVDLILMILELLHQGIYSYNCDTLKQIIYNINNSVDILIQILNMIQSIWIDELNYGKIDDLGYKSQLQRLLYTVDITINKLTCMKLSDNLCNKQLISNLLYILTEYTLIILGIISDQNGLNSYYSICKNIGCEIYELIINRFINNITELEYINTRLNHLVGILYSDNKNVNYNSTYVPNSIN